MILPPYNPSAKCVKCGSERVDTAFHLGECTAIIVEQIGRPPVKVSGAKPHPCSQTVDPHMLRHCSNCGYEWLEAPVDQIEEAVQYPFSGYAFGRYQLQGKGGPKHLRAWVEFKGMTEDEAKKFADELLARYESEKPISAS